MKRGTLIERSGDSAAEDALGNDATERVGVGLERAAGGFGLCLEASGRGGHLGVRFCTGARHDFGALGERRSSHVVHLLVDLAARRGRLLLELRSRRARLVR